MDFQKVIDAAHVYFAEKGMPLAMSALTAIAILVLGRIAAKLIVGGFRRGMERSKTDITLVKFLSNIFYAGLLTLVVLAALERVGVNTTSFAAVIAAAGLAIGFALQGSLSNFAAGVMLILFHHFKVGDVIEAAGVKGKVDELQIFWTVLHADDGTKIICPNSAVTAGVIKVSKPA